MNCYQCAHSASIPGNEHIKCVHPINKAAHENNLAVLFGLLAGIGRTEPIVCPTTKLLGVVINPVGIQRGWANWPWNFDPTWIEKCNGYTQKVEADGQQATLVDESV